MAQLEDAYDVKRLFSLDGQVAVVTGAAQGMGFGIAKMLAAAGARLSISDLSLDTVTAARAKILDQIPAADIACFQCDISDGSQVEKMFEDTEAALGVPDVLVNNAGIAYLCPFEEISLEKWKRVFDVNTHGTFLCTQQAVKRLRRAGKPGSIISIGSVNSVIEIIYDNVHYAAAKAALNGMTRSLALETAADAIRVNIVWPGAILTEASKSLRDPTIKPRGPITFPEQRLPMGYRGEPADIAGAVLYLASPASRYVTGQAIAVDGGFLVS